MISLPVETMSEILQHNTNIATVHSRVTVGGCSVEYDTNFYISLLALLYTEYYIPVFCFIYLYNIAAGPHEEFLIKNNSSLP